MDDQRLLTLAEIEQRTGRSRRSLERDIRARALEIVRFGRTVRVTPEAYRAYVDRARSA